MGAHILIVDDEEDIRKLIKGILEDESYGVREAGTSKGALNAISEKCPDLVILDIWLQGSDQDGLAVLEDIKAMHTDLPVLMISGHGTVETAVSAIKKGAYDFIEKPFKADRLLLMIARALEAAALKKENKTLKTSPVDPVLDLIGESAAVKNLRKQIEQAAQVSSRVMILGETGTGKSMTARLVHEYSPRATHPYTVVNCVEAFDPKLFEEAIQKTGQGSLVLNHIDCLSTKDQDYLMQALQGQDFEARLISIANADIQNNSGFSDDLFSRLNLVQINVPHLKDRAADIPALAAHFVQKFARNAGAAVKDFSPEALLALQQKNWTGNICALKNYIELCCSAHMEKEGAIQVRDLPSLDFASQETAKAAAPAKAGLFDLSEDILMKSLRDAREMFERVYLSAQMERFAGSVSETAKSIGMERSALHRKLKSLDLSPNGTQDKPDSGEEPPLQKRA